MSEFLSDRTVIGIGTTLISVGVALWRRIRPPSGPPWYVRIARIGSAITRLQVAEGSLDSVKESLLLEREETAYLRAQLRDARIEMDRLRERTSSGTSSATPPLSDPSSDGSTGSRGEKTRKRRTT